MILAKPNGTIAGGKVEDFHRSVASGVIAMIVPMKIIIAKIPEVGAGSAGARPSKSCTLSGLTPQ
jgi:hypothetical protein